MTVGEYTDRYLAALQAGELTVRPIEETAEQLIDVNRKQLSTGRDAQGNLIGDRKPYKLYIVPDIGKLYPQIKYEMNPVPGWGNPDLKYTGAFYSGISFQIIGMNVNWYGKDSKTSDLLAKYGPILGVYENTPLQEYRNNYLYPAVVKAIKNAIR